MSSRKEWLYVDPTTGQWSDALISFDELNRLHNEGIIEDDTYVISQLMARRGPRASGVPYSQITQLGIDFSPPIELFYQSRRDEPVTVLSGPNNCGKTLVLKQLFALVGEGGYLVSCNRFSHVDVLNTRPQEEAQYRNYYNNFVQQFYTSRQNTEDSEFKLEHAITGLNNSQRKHLFAICRGILGNTFSLKRTQPDNEFSPFYVDMDGENLRYGSTGTRLLLTLLGIVLNDKFTKLLIDEPEIGLSPRTQSALADLLYDPQNRREYWPHLVQLWVATHSHLFLDRRIIGNNHTVSKSGKLVTLKRTGSIGEFHQLQFNMLGNEFESIFLPSAIVILEGESDVSYFTRLAGLHIPQRRVAAVRAGSDGEVLDKLNVLRETFGDLAASPYRDRVFVVLDQKNSVRSARIEKMGIPAANIKVWSKNGIEYYYPTGLICEAFHCDEKDVAAINLEVDPIEANGIRISKKDLARFVSDRITANSPLDEELIRFLGRVRTGCG